MDSRRAAVNLARRYRTWPDEPLPALGGRTPRQAVRDAAGRRAVVELLRTFEASERTQPEPMRNDFGWVWDELGLAGDREPG